MFIEFAGGFLTNSLALTADAGHMLSDAAALGLSLFAAMLVLRPPTARKSYGFYRAEILAALVNGAALIAISAFIFVEALRRFSEPPQVGGPLMLGIAAGGLIINIVSLGLLSGGKKDNLNMHGAWLHVFTDMLGSVGAIAAGAAITLFDWYWADPVASILISLLVVHSAWFLIKESVSVLMENAPRHLDVDQIRLTLLNGPGVTEVHDLHVWSISSGLIALSAHVIVADEVVVKEILAHLRHSLAEQYGIDHVTLQIEPGGLSDAAVTSERCSLNRQQ
jgi:cobalt-zinc-cadmium efflux system protein